MQDVEMAMEDESKQNTSHTSLRPRTKKKSTLTKLKEKKLRELGSTSSLQRDDSVENTLESSQPVKESGAESANALSKPGHYTFSTKDPPEVVAASKKESRPKPKPRARRRSSDLGNGSSSFENGSSVEKAENEKNSSKRQNSIGSDGSTVQMFRNLKMGGDQPESVDSAVIVQGGFVPKPPSTPRTPKSTPRTPRGYIVTGKGEKRLREPWSSGDEPEVEEKKEKNHNTKDQPAASDNVESVRTSTWGSGTDTLHSTNGAMSLNGDGNDLPSPRRQIPGQPKYGERLLKRRGSRDAATNSGQVDDLKQKGVDLGKPPINRSLANANNHNINNSGSNPSTTSTAKVEETSNVSSKDKYLKSANRSRSKSPSGQDNHKEVASSSVTGPGSDLSPNKNLIYSSPSHLSVNANVSRTSSAAEIMSQTTDALHMQYERLLLTDIDGGNKSTNVLFTTESPLKMRSIISPPTSARLDPISPKSQPPPLAEDFSSRSLRTTYKIDPNVRPSTGSGRTGTVGDKSDSGAHSNGDRVSQRSFASGGVLPVITTKEARSRSCLEGSISSGSPSMLGSEELDRYFPERKVNVLVGTWNMNELKDVTTSLDDFILPEKCDYVQDIYAIGTQENAMNKKEWEIKIQETLGPSHVMFHSISHASLHLVVYIRRDLIWFCSTPEDDVISLRAVSMVKTKGAIGIAFTLFGTSYLFINCHLTSDRDNDNSRKKSRLGDYFKVIQEMKLPKSSQNSSTKKPTDITAIFDCVFWCGDLNFRIERKRHAVEGKVNEITSEEFPNFETLLGGDQLLKYMTEGKIFGGFQEGRINFHPTFKFDVNQDTYDSSAKNRVPSYTDRIMFRCKTKNDIACMHYDAVMAIKLSDHRPVYGQFETGIKPGRDNMVYSAGHFDRTVYLEANRRRAAKQPVKKKPSAVCTIQ